jgi:hypothetical protein
MDVQETRRAVCAIGIVGKINGKDVIYRESAIEIVRRRESELQAWKDALWKACGDDEQVVNDTVESQRMPDNE